MVQDDIYTKFAIEYDKANVTSSYPSLTKYEIATILDKAYLALLSQKVSGNNIRKVPFEYDSKAIEDVRLLQKQLKLYLTDDVDVSLNEYVYELPKDFLYYVDGRMDHFVTSSAIDGKRHSSEEVTLINHETAKKFKITDTNMPWIKKPVVYFQGTKIRMLVDPYKFLTLYIPTLTITYIKEPLGFVTNINNSSATPFELNDSMAEELINIAIVFATESVESTRLQTKTSILQLES